MTGLVCLDSNSSQFSGNFSWELVSVEIQLTHLTEISKMLGDFARQFIIGQIKKANRAYISYDLGISPVKKLSDKRQSL